MPTTHRSFRALAVLAVALGFAAAASAGPPLICHPFVTDAAAPMLPWTPSRDWHSPDPSYDAAALVTDTLGLLSADAPILARMENMRRAAIYADGHPELAAALLRALLERAKAPPADARAAALASFDAGYLVETYRQLGLIYQHNMRQGQWRPLVPADLADLDGYALVQKALRVAPEKQAEIEFASWLMTNGASADTHRDRAVAGSTPGSLLARNLEHYDVR